MKRSQVQLVFICLVLSILVISALAACSAPPPQIVPQTVVVPETVIAPQTVVASQTVIVPQTIVVPQTVIAKQTVVVTPTALPNPEAVIPNVEPNAEITLWTFWMSPAFDDYIKRTIARFQQVYPGVKVNWQDQQAAYQDNLKLGFANGTAPDVMNLSVSEGWVGEYAANGLLLPLQVPQAVQSSYFPGLWQQGAVDGKNYQFPWYQGLDVELVNMKIYSDTAGLTLADFPKTVDGLPALCKTIKTKTGAPCVLRLDVNNLLAQMAYEGGVKILSDDGKKFTFDSPEGAAWLQMYADMVRAESVDKNVLLTDRDRAGLDEFVAGKAAFVKTNPSLIREIRAFNPGMYGYLAAAPVPVGKSGLSGSGLMSLSVNAKTKYPNASVALAQFFTNPQSMLEFSKLVAVYPSTQKAYTDPFFAATPVAIEDSVKPLAQDTISKYGDAVPVIPKQTDVNDIVLQAVQSVLLNNVPAQQALTNAAAKANALIAK